MAKDWYGQDMELSKEEREEQAGFDQALEWFRKQSDNQRECQIMHLKMGIYNIPDYMREGLMLYLREGLASGSFLLAVLSNDLKKAVFCAGAANQTALAGYVNFLSNYAPALSWGSSYNVKGYLAAGNRRRARTGE